MEVRALYERILKVANYFVKNASASGLTIDGLKKLDPSVQQIAKDMRMLAVIIRGLAGESYEDENMAINAFQCCLIMERLADAVASEQQGQLDALMKELERHITVP